MKPVLLDTFGRKHNNLRVSVTDRCNLRCTYCMPEDVTFLDKSELLSFEEITRVVRVANTLGVDKVRLTGGEPLLRKDLPTLVQMLADIRGLNDIGLTTNGLLLKAQAQALYDGGLRRLNVSLDTLDEARFEQLSRRPGLNAVLAGLDEAKRVGFGRIKINAVSIRGFTDQDAVPLAKYCREMGFELRFIEFMPIGAGPWDRHSVFAAHEILETLEEHVGALVPVADADPSAPATEFEYADGGGRVGIIASVTRPFCTKCNRLRLTAEGKLRACLFSLEETDVKGLLRNSPGDEAIAKAIQTCVTGKWAGHEINLQSFRKPERTMHAIGG